MYLRRLWLEDFRNYEHAEVDLARGLTAVIGDNGQGKSNLVEAIGYLATLSSFRGAPNEALVRKGRDRAVVRAEGERAGRSLLIEAEIAAHGRGRVLVNKQRLVRNRDLLGALRVTIFAPDDLALVKGAPVERRRFLDDALVAIRTSNDLLRTEYERVVRQRNALLRQAGGRLAPDIATTLEVWDAKLVETGEALAAQRVRLLDVLEPYLSNAYDQVAGVPAAVTARYVAPWREHGLAAAIHDLRRDELRRGVSLVGPHRDDVELRIDDLPARTHGSQGEQRSLAFALRLAVHTAVTDVVGAAPLLVLDDVFSELDPRRSDALLRALPPGQTVLTTAVSLPSGARCQRVLQVHDGLVVEQSAVW
ncbi:DNA replication/repair protein RecF [Rhabdothermincola sp.]|uniref:DNA replication/repair protein RecF n=1 Tax=Rhabdothermincola sp. TaxID=2820405 RepID=UPI002FE2E0E1